MSIFLYSEKDLLKMSEEIKKTGVQEVVVIVVYQPVYHTESWEGRLYIDLDYLQTGEFGFELDDEYIERIKKQGFIEGCISRTDVNSQALAWRLPKSSESFYRSVGLSEWIDDACGNDGDPRQITYDEDVSGDDKLGCLDYGESGFEHFYDKNENVVISGTDIGDGDGIELIASLNKIDGIKFVARENSYRSYDYCEDEYFNVVLRFELNGIPIEEEYTILQSAVDRINFLLNSVNEKSEFDEFDQQGESDEFWTCLEAAGKLWDYGDKERYREMIRKALTRAEGTDELLEVRQFLIDNVEDKDLEQEVFSQAIVRSETVPDLLMCAEGISGVDNLYMEKVYQSAENKANTSEDLRLVAESISLNAKNDEWTRRIYQTAINKAKNSDDLKSIALSISENMHDHADKEWALQLYQEAIDIAIDIESLVDLAHTLSDKNTSIRNTKLSRKVYQLAIDKAKRIDEFVLIAGSLSSGVDRGWARRLCEIAVNQVESAQEKQDVVKFVKNNNYLGKQEWGIKFCSQHKEN